MKKIALGISNDQAWMHQGFFYNFNALIKPEYCMIVEGKARIKVVSLNEIISKSYKWNADYIFFMDIDHQFEQDTLVKLLKHDKDIVGGLYHLRQPPFSPVAGWFKDEDVAVNQNKNIWNLNYAKFPFGDKDGLVEVDWTGVGCLLVKMSVFDKIDWKKKPLVDIWDNERGVRKVGHDVNLCQRAKEIGIKTYIDRTINCGHLWNFYIG